MRSRLEIESTLMEAVSDLRKSIFDYGTSPRKENCAYWDMENSKCVYGQVNRDPEAATECESACANFKCRYTNQDLQEKFQHVLNGPDSAKKLPEITTLKWVLGKDGKPLKTGFFSNLYYVLKYIWRT